MEEREPYLNDEEDIIMADSMEDHWRYVAEDGEDKSKIHSLRWGLYTKDK